MAKKHGPNKENLEATRKLFLQIARHEFSTKGFYGTSTADIVEESGMARGSLYYHFGDKKGLFRAVYYELMVELQAIIRGTVANENDPWAVLMTASNKWLDICTDPYVRRIVIDVHTAIPYQERIEILQETLMNELSGIMKNVVEAGYFKGQNPRMLTMMIFGLLSESGRSLELAQDAMQARTELGETYMKFMETARG
ncbi:MAG: TetR/AcrR family transcriptional regulator [Micavibrio sp.]